MRKKRDVGHMTLVMLALLGGLGTACSDDAAGGVPSPGAPAPADAGGDRAPGTTPPPAPADAGGHDAAGPALASPGFGPAAAVGDTLTAGSMTASQLSFGNMTVCATDACITRGFAR